MSNFEPEKQEQNNLTEEENNKSTEFDMGLNEPDARKIPPSAPPMPPYGYAVAYPPVQQKPQGRRVGTITMACALIAMGILMVVATFNEAMGLAMAVKLAPVILIVLGIEILVRYAFSKGEKLRYDFLSGFVCFLLITASLVMAIVPAMWHNWGPRRNALQAQLSYDTRARLSEVLANEKDVNYLDTDVYLQREVLPNEMKLSDLSVYDHVNGTVRLINTFETQEAFADRISQILKKIETAGIPFDTIHFDTDTAVLADGKEISYFFGFVEALGYELTQEQILSRITINEFGIDDYDLDIDLEEYNKLRDFAEQYPDVFSFFRENGYLPDAAS